MFSGFLSMLFWRSSRTEKRQAASILLAKYTSKYSSCEPVELLLIFFQLFILYCAGSGVARDNIQRTAATRPPDPFRNTATMRCIPFTKNMYISSILRGSFPRSFSAPAYAGSCRTDPSDRRCANKNLRLSHSPHLSLLGPSPPRRDKRCCIYRA